MSEMVVFKSNDRLYGVDVTGVQEVLKRPHLSLAPKTSLSGVASLRGMPLGVVSARARLGAQEDQFEEAGAMVVDTGSEKYMLLVDSVEGVADIEECTSEGVPGNLDAASSWVYDTRRWGSSLVALLDVSALIYG